MFIYKTTNIVNGKSYIGKYAGKKSTYLGSGIALKKAIDKYGKDSFVREVIEECNNLIHLSDREKYWIEKLNAVNSPNYYNMTEGGDGSFSHITKEHYQKRQNKRYGKKLTPPDGSITSKYIQEYKVTVDGEVHIIQGMDRVSTFLKMDRVQVYKYLNNDGPLQGYKYNSLEVAYHTEVSYLIEGIEYKTIEEVKNKYPDLKPGTMSNRLLKSDRWDWWKIVKKI